MARRVGTAEVQSHRHTAARHLVGHSRHPADRSRAVNQEGHSLRVANQEDHTLRVVERREGHSLQVVAHREAPSRQVVNQEDRRHQEAEHQEAPSRQEAERQAGHSHHHPVDRSLREDSRHPAPEPTRGHLCSSLH